MKIIKSLQMTAIFLSLFYCALANAAIVWTESTTSTTSQTFYDVASNLDGSVLVAVGNSAINYSTDGGVNWTASTTTITQTLEGVAFGNGKFIAIGQSGALWTSTNGANWTSQAVTTPSSGNFFAITFDGSKFLALDGVKAYSSVDGIHWIQSGTLSLSSVRRLIWTGSTFLAVGWSAVASSADGVNWSVTQINDGGGGFNGIASNGSVHVIVGNGGRIWSTTDGSNWFKRPSPTTDEMQDIVWTGEGFVAVGWNGAIFQSVDGVTWSYSFMLKGNGFSPSGRRYGLLQVGRKLVAVGQSPSFVGTLPTLIPWHNTTSTASPFGNSYFKGIASDGAGNFVAVSSGSAFSSSDGVTWSKSTWALSGVYLQGVEYDPVKSRFIAVGGTTYQAGSTPHLFFSADNGVTWSADQVTGATNAGGLYAVASFGTWRVAIGGNGSVYRSSTPGTWSKQTSIPSSSHLNDIACKGNNTVNTCVAVHFTGVWSSTDAAVTWTAQAVDPANGIRLRAIATDGTRFVAAGYNLGASTGTKTVATSTDGVTWTLVDTGVTNEIKDIAYDSTNARFIAVGENGMTLVSADGTQWDTIDTAIGTWLQGVAWNGTRYVAVGNSAAKLVAENDVSAPTLSISIENGVTDTNKQYATVGLTCSDGAYGSGCDAMRFSSDGINWSEWAPFATSAVIDLVAGDGMKTVYAQVRDLAGHTSASAQDSVILDTVAPAAPSWSVPASGSYFASSTFTASGSAPAGTTVLLYEGTNQLGSATANGAGSWSIASGTLADGVYSLTAKARDVAGNLSTATTAVSVTIDTVKPRLQSTGSQSDATHVDITFSEAVAGATTASNFSGSNGLSITAVSLQSGNTYRLTTSHQTHGTAYNITASGITDMAGNAIDINNQVVTFTRSSNTPPSLTGPATSQSVNEDSTLLFNLSASDNDNDVLIYGTVSGAVHGSVGVNASSGVISYTPSLNYSGSDGFTLKVTDEAGAIASRIFNITVNAVNDPPYFTGTPAVSGTLMVGQQLSVVNDSFSDVDSASVSRTYQWTANGSVIPGANSNTFTLTASQAHLPISSVITLDDGAGGVTTQTVVAGSVGNSAPLFTGTPALSGSFTVGSAVAVSGVGTSDSDNDQVTLHYQWRVNGKNVGIDASNYTILPADAHRTIDCIVTANDGHGGLVSYTTAAQSIQNTAPSFVGTPWIGGLIRTVGSSLSVQVAGTGDADGDSVTLSYQWRSGGTNITAGATSGTYTIQSTDAHQNIDVVITASDPYSGSVTATTAQVIVQNSAPQFTGTLAISGTAKVGSTLSVTGDSYSDVDGDTVATSYQWQAGGVNITGATGRSYTLTTAEAHANISVVVTLDDGHGGVVSASPAQSVAMGNTAPIFSTTPAISLVSPKVGDLLALSSATATDADADLLTYGYQWQASADGGVTFVNIANANAATMVLAAADAHKKIRCVITVDDGKQGTALATTGAVMSGNTTPVAKADVASPVVEDSLIPATIPVLLNDSDADGDPLSVQSLDATSALGGTLSLNTDGSINYTPYANATGSDSFNYVITDGYATATAKVTIEIVAVNDPPQVNADATLTLSEDPIQPATSVNVLANDVDVDGDPLTIAQFDSYSASGGVVQQNAGTFSYTPAANFYGTDTVGYTVSDGQGGLTDGVLLIAVASVNDAPTAIALDRSTIDENLAAGSVVGSLSVSDVDLPADSYSFAIIGGAGAASFGINGSDLYATASFNFEAKASYGIQLQVTDAYGASFVAPFTIAVNDINEAPTAVSAVASTSQSQPVVIRPVVTDPDLSDRHTFTVVGSVAHGTVTFQNGQTELVYTPDAFFNGSDSFTIEVTDGGGNKLQGTVDVAVAADPALAVITSLSLDLSRQNIQPTETIDVFGKLTTVSNAAGVNIYGQPLTVTVQDAYSVQRFTTTVNDSYGHFILSGLNAFPSSGDYTVQVDFAGIPGVLAQASSAVRSVLVGASAGYAIVIEGRLSTNEGLASHNKTLDRAYEKLIDRGFDKRNIRYLNFDTTRIGQDVYAVPSRAVIQDAIENWAAARMQSVPAPLYLIMVDHGSIDTFYIDPEIITPSDINSWLNTLDSKLAGTPAASEKKVIIYGACYSGSFIPTIAKPGRIIVSSAAADEVSYKGPLEPDNIRSGEYFMESFFDRLGKGDSIGLAFTKATKETEEYTKKGDGLSSNSKYGDGGAQHPLIDANGDGIGVNELLEGVGDDLYARSIFLGRGATYNTNAAYSVAEVVDTIPTQHLDAQSSAIQLWAKANNDAQVNSLWMEIRTPAMQLLTRNSTVQVATGFTKKPLQLIGGKWSASAADFVASGKYEVFFFARDDGPLKDGTGPVSPMKRSVVYKNYAGNAAPSAFTLGAPTDGYTIPTSSLFSWNPSTDPDGVTYTFTIASDVAMSQVVYRQEELTTTYALVDGNAGLVDGLTYFWRVDAVDGFGAVSSSAVRTFTTGNTNSASGTVSVKVLDATTNGKITGATITVTASNGGSYNPALTSGNLSLFMGVPNGAITVNISAPGYYTKAISRTFNAGDALVVNAMMVLQPGKDTVPPVVTAPADITVEATGPATAVTLGSATVTDNRDKNLMATANVTGSFALGTSTVTWSAVDGSNNRASATQKVTVVDTTPATISLNGPAAITIEAGSAYVDQGAVASDLVDGSKNLTATGAVDSGKVGSYTLSYDYTDGAGNVSATVTRTVTVVDTTPPVFTTASSDLYVEATGAATPVSLPAMFASDLGLTIAAVPDNSGPFPLGATQVTFTATDSAGNSSQRSMSVVVQDTTAPVITILGSNPMVIDQYATYTDAGATANDVLDGILTVTTSGTVDTTIPGSYQISYSVTDAHNNSATAVRDVIVLVKVQPGSGSVLNITQGDSDGDGVLDTLDKFPTDPAASLDTDNDGFPDRWNVIKQQFMVATTLTLDAFINDARYHADIDHDGMADSWEVQFFGNLTTANAVTDYDGDGITDLNEFIDGSDPTFRADTLVTLGDAYADAGGTASLPVTMEVASGVQVSSFILRINLDLYGLTIGRPTNVPAGWNITTMASPSANGTPGQVVVSGSGSSALSGVTRFNIPVTFASLSRGSGYVLSVDHYSSASNGGVALSLGGHDGSLRVAVSQPATITLNSGWNLIAVSNDAGKQGLNNLLAAAPQIQSVWQYTTSGWSSYLTALAGMGINTLTSLQAGSVYWIQLPNNAVSRQVILPGITPLSGQSAALRTGWNLVVPAGTTTDPAVYLSTVGGKQLWGFVNGSWVSYISGASAFLNSLTTLQQGQGYYVLK